MDPEQLVALLEENLKPGGYMFLSGPWLAPSHINQGERARASLALIKESLERRQIKVAFATEQGGIIAVWVDLVVSCLPPRLMSLVRMALNALLSPFLAKARPMSKNGDCTGWLVVGRKV